MIKQPFLVPFFLLVGLVASAQKPSIYTGVEFDMPKVPEPVFPEYRVSIVQNGAEGDGRTLNSDAIAQSIAQVSEHGGGTVVIPRGIWLTGPVTLKSNVNLHLEEGALLLFTADKTQYPLISTSFEGLDTYRCLSPVNGVGLENIAITGSGTIDGNGDAWRAVKKSKMAEAQWKALVSSGGLLSADGKTWYPSESYRRGAEATSGFFNVPETQSKADFEAFKDFLRPVMVSLVNCKGVLLDGPTFQNSPAWNLHPLMCENVIIRNLNVRNPWYSQNGDGLDLESCKNALIYNNTFDVGDDAICIKSGKDEDGRNRGIPSENVIIKNNVVYHGHGGFVVGSEMSGGVKNIQVSQCTFMGTDVGLRFKSTRGRGGVVENIYISDIDMINIPTEPIRFNLFYGGQSPVPEEGQEAAVVDEHPVPVTEETPAFRNIYMKNITAVNSGAAGYFQGLPEMNLQNIRLENVNLEAQTGISLIDADGVTFQGVTVSVRQGIPLTIYNGKNIVVKEFRAVGRPGEAATIKVMGTRSEGILLDKADYEDSETEVKVGKEVGKKAVKVK